MQLRLALRPYHLQLLRGRGRGGDYGGGGGGLMLTPTHPAGSPFPEFPSKLHSLDDCCAGGSSVAHDVRVDDDDDDDGARLHVQ